MKKISVIERAREDRRDNPRLILVVLVWTSVLAIGLLLIGASQ